MKRELPPNDQQKDSPHAPVPPIGSANNNNQEKQRFFLKNPKKTENEPQQEDNDSQEARERKGKVVFALAGIFVFFIVVTSISLVYLSSKLPKQQSSLLKSL